LGVNTYAINSTKARDRSGAAYQPETSDAAPLLSWHGEHTLIIMMTKVAPTGLLHQ
jgi:hypothetical protein